MRGLRVPGRLASLAVPGVVTIGVLVLLAASLAMGGHDPATAFRALIGGALGSPQRVLSITLVRATPLVIAGLAVAFAFRAGVWNIGAEGQLLAGAGAAAVVGLWLPGSALDPGTLTVVVAIGFGCAAGGLWAVLPAFLRVRRGTNEVISTILMNFVAIYLLGFLVHGPLQESRGVFPQSDPISESAHLPILVPGSRLHVGFALALLLAVAIGFVMARTRFGLHLRAVGSAPAAAEVAGRIRSGRVIASTLVLSGAMAGLAGSVEVTGLTHALYENLSPGYGYTAIAVALLGGLRPAGVVAAGIFFGALEGGASAMQREAAVPAVWVDGVEALVILAVVSVHGLRGRWGAEGDALDAADPEDDSDTGPADAPARESTP